MTNLLGLVKLKRNRPIFLVQGGAHFEAFVASSKEEMPPFIKNALAEWRKLQAVSAPTASASASIVPASASTAPSSAPTASASASASTAPASAPPTVASARTASASASTAQASAYTAPASATLTPAVLCPEEKLTNLKRAYTRVELEDMAYGSFYSEVYQAHLFALHQLRKVEKDLATLEESFKVQEEELLAA
eukprot:6174101-Pleurochrysis_carterae.AAC.4